MTPGGGKRRLLLALCLILALVFAGLGTWQVQRLGWKRDLIARVGARIHAPPVAVPLRQEWAGLDLHDAEYRRVQARGVFRHDRETLVDALTVLGPGAWVLTPLETRDGVILVNRGFVPPERRAAAARPEGQVQAEIVVTGLLRVSEPGGRLLRPNDPAADRWFSRDVGAIAAVRGIEGPAPFFIDVEAASGVQGGPTAGLTVVKFRNAHLAYAGTWFGLALLCCAGVVLLFRNDTGAAQRP